MGRPNEPAHPSAGGEFSCALRGVDLLGEPLRGPVAPRGDQRLTNGTLLGGPQPDVCGTTATPAALDGREGRGRSEEHTSELQSPCNLVCRLLLEKKKEII